MALDHEFVTIVSNTTAVTGSIMKVVNIADGVIDETTFGVYGGHGTTSAMTGSSGGLLWKGVQQYNTNITLFDGDGGQYAGSGKVDGPMCAVKLASGVAAVYHRGTLIT